MRGASRTRKTDYGRSGGKNSGKECERAIDKYQRKEGSTTIFPKHPRQHDKTYYKQHSPTASNY